MTSQSPFRNQNAAGIQYSKYSKLIRLVRAVLSIQGYLPYGGTHPLRRSESN